MLQQKVSLKSSGSYKHLNDHLLIYCMEMFCYPVKAWCFPHYMWDLSEFFLTGLLLIFFCLSLMKMDLFIPQGPISLKSVVAVLHNEIFLDTLLQWQNGIEWDEGKSGDSPEFLINNDRFGILAPTTPLNNVTF